MASPLYFFIPFFLSLFHGDQLLSNLENSPHSFPEVEEQQPELQTNDQINRQILYSLHTGHLHQALELYQQHRQKNKRHDLTLVQQIGLTLLDRGSHNRDPQIQLLTLFGAGISSNERCLYILEQGLNSPVPELQIIALNFLAKYQNDRADEALNKALAANHLLIRLEALNCLAQKKHPKALGQIEALMAKVDEKLLPLFPQLYAMIDDVASTKVLKRLLAHPDEKVRIASILSVAKYDCDDLLPQIRKLAAQHSLIQQEACAIALGMLRDESSIPRLEHLTRSNSLTTKLAALQALYRLGKKEVRQPVEQIAKEGNLFAISILGEFQGSEDVLYELTKSPQLQIRLNAGLALLDREDPRCLKAVAEILLKDSRDLAFVKTASISGGLIAWKVVPSASQNLKEEPIAFELSLNLREATLEKTMTLPPDEFLKLAELIFETHQNELVSLTTHQLENIRSHAAIQLLKTYAQKAGAPLVRNYCNLALFNLKEPGPYEESLRQWITAQQEEDFIRLRPYIPWDERDLTAHYELSPHETSKLLIEAFEAFAKTQEDKGVDVLLDALLHGNTKNRYAIAGLLIRATN